ncbi:BrnA antitoxin family protein [Candidatus Rariloculus sp.]|uniref:BrnA antitoxin family protein n=1 Tax=Candidatus Rariloculus sp. TaxID=3101265 RepID=UPI003D117F7E
MSGNEGSTRPDSDEELIPDLSQGDWPAKFAKAKLRRGRPRIANPRVSTTIRLSPEVIDHFKADGPGWQTRVNEALREWIAIHNAG